MATMQEVADLAGVSRATASIVINGKQGERKIPEETCQKIYEAMNTLGYRPNIMAKRLRGGTMSGSPIIALYWPSDFRINYMARYIQGIQDTIKASGYHCELVARTYAHDQLHTEAEPIIRGSYNAAIFAGISADDLAFLERLSFQIPVVLLNRSSSCYHTVSCDNEAIARQAIQLFCEKHYQEAAVITAEETYLSSSIRTSSFLETARKHGIRIPEGCLIQTSADPAGGARAAERFLSLSHRPKAVFCDSDYTALGFTAACLQNNLSIPEDLELLSIGMLSPEFTEFSVPSITTLSLPIEKMAADSLAIVMDCLKHRTILPIHHEHSATLLLRSSFSLS